jgi:hypothetical protein
VKRSPLKAKPLRNPGQSLDEEIERLTGDQLGNLLLVLACVLGMVVLAWVQWLGKMVWHPGLVTVVALPIVAFIAVRLVRMRRRLVRLRLGRDGERAVGQFLESLRKDGHVVLHDVVGEGFNLDHVLIGPKGVFALETKTYTKPARGNPQIKVTAAGICLGGGRPRDRSIKQTAAQRVWLRRLIKELTGRDLRVRSVLLYPGWFVERSAHSITSELWVLDPRSLVGFIAHEPDALSDADQHLVTYSLSRFVRTS